MNKEKQQTIILAVLILGIVGALVYFNLDRLKPKAISGIDIISDRAELRINFSRAEELFSRDDYKGLTEFGNVPVTPMGLGNEDPFPVEIDEEDM